MAKILSDVMTGKRSVPQPYDATVIQVSVAIVLPAALAVNDLLSLIELPPGVDLVDYDIFAPQLDSNAAPTNTYSIGSENAAGTDLAVVYETGLTAGRTATGSVSRCTVAAQLASDRNTARKVSLKVTAAFATYAGAGKSLLAIFHVKS
ncbi:hypothetical protein [Variovorax sp. PAMC26660]|uniref:hypothetical protein n=1 Tax=Variovorax sp. PAMC26660 TaxID=2762322 RepID=UPI00164E4A71|nr:hypothetical protein [Variovorax sp. PAMC26660]QNK66083.1 hypothetical protein H7F35_23165 [Variovorax sp. PAMC26660]